MNSLEIQDTVQKSRIYGCFNRSLITIRFTFRKSKKNYSRCIYEPICTIYYAEAHRHSLHEPFSLAVNLVRNIKPRRVFANHRNKQPT